MPTVAGILEICAGATSLIGSFVLAFMAVASHSLPHGVSEPVPEWPFEMGFALFLGLATLLLVLGLVAVIGGIQALRGTRGFWPIIGAIAASLSCLPLGVPAIVLTVMSENDMSSTRAAGGRDTGGHISNSLR
ncbi:MAG: hypothetical protein OEN01_09040 [Candidatus Krumholzibacteria bacterium]|nr:hypothetical protein [Candidatus Krumholzibacteria bacterium]